MSEAAPAFDTAAPAASEYQVGNYSVAEQTGAATYSYPIPVPPGRNQMAPQISLDYSSRAPLRGGVAAGWNLSLPSIELEISSAALGEER